jgi:hypothetical protein
MRCARGSAEVVPCEGWRRLAVTAGRAGQVWRVESYPWPNVQLCGKCSTALDWWLQRPPAATGRDSDAELRPVAALGVSIH